MDPRKRKKEDNLLKQQKTIMVYVYGHITSKTFDIWNKSLSHIPSENLKVVSHTSHNKIKHIDFIIIDNNDVIINDEISKLISVDTKIVHKQWILDSLKSNILLPTANYRIQQKNKADKSIDPTSETTLKHNQQNKSDFITDSTLSDSHGNDDSSGDHVNRDDDRVYNNNTNNDVNHTNVSSSTTEPNQYIIDKLKNLENIYTSTHDDHRTRAYRRCCQILSKQPHITNIQQLEQLKTVSGIGKSMLAKIEEIVQTGNLKKLDNFQSDPKILAMQEISSIWGVGPVSAEKLYLLGIRQVKDLESKSPQELSHLLNDQQLIGLKRHHDINQRIPRDEVNAIIEMVSKTVNKICPGIICVCCGSYRRGKATCGDVDILLSPPDLTSSSSSSSSSAAIADGSNHNTDCHHILSELIAELSKIGFLTDHLSLPGNHSRHGSVGTLKLSNNSSSSSSSASTIASPSRMKRHRHHDSAGYDNNDDDNDDDDDEEEEGGTSKRSSYMGICKLPDNQSNNSNSSNNSSSNDGSDNGCSSSSSSSGSGRSDSSTSSKYVPSSSSSSSSLHRRIDIKCYSRQYFPFALLYFTGSDIFNRSMRYYADKHKGYTLSDKGIRSCIRSHQNNREKLIKGKSISCQDEKEIFDVLGLEYKEPWEREGIVQPVVTNSNSSSSHNSNHNTTVVVNA